jgi:hypothetical protein
MALHGNLAPVRKSRLATQSFFAFLVFFCVPSYAETVMSKAEIRGVYLGLGIECPQFMIDSGEQVSLIGKQLDDLTAGNRFRLTGQIARASKCMQGQTFIVSTVAVADAETGK